MTQITAVHKKKFCSSFILKNWGNFVGNKNVRRLNGFRSVNITVSFILNAPIVVYSTLVDLIDESQILKLKIFSFKTIVTRGRIQAPTGKKVGE